VSQKQAALAYFSDPTNGANRRKAFDGIKTGNASTYSSATIWGTSSTGILGALTTYANAQNPKITI
jgi:hypothetical protein